MGFRFSRSVRVLPGVRLNFSTRGVSTSIGGRGATLNLGRGGARATVGLPGTGLSYSTRLLKGARRPRPDAFAVGGEPGRGASALGWIVLIGLVLLVGSCLTRSPEGPEAVASVAGAPALPAMTVSDARVNCRAVPVSGPVLGQLDQGTRVEVTDRRDGWTRIARMGGDCWIADRLLTPA